MIPYESTLDLYNFDRCTGLLSNRITYDYPGGNKPGGVAFSDSSHYLYVSVWDTIYQYDLWTPDILASQEVVAVYDGFKADFGKPTTFFSMLLGPDKKIYICTANSNTRYLHTIEKPEKKGMACDVKQHSVYLPSFNNYMVPNMPYYRLYDWKDSPCDTIGMVATKEPEASKQTGFSLQPNPATDQFQILFSQPTTEPAQLTITDVSGKTLQSTAISIGVNDLIVSTENLPPGCYLVQVLSEAGRPEVRKLFIAR
jgi:Secretion system C-terminal sorting domain